MSARATTGVPRSLDFFTHKPTGNRGTKVGQGQINPNQNQRPQRPARPAQPAPNNNPQPKQSPKQNNQKQTDGLSDEDAERLLSSKGSSYKVRGKEQPDAWQTQRLANKRNISIEILHSSQDSHQAAVTVRAHAPEGQFADAVVVIDFINEYLIKENELAKRAPDLVESWSNDLPPRPKFKDTAKVKGESVRDYLSTYYLQQRQFGIRSARTKASSIAERILLNKEWQESEEKESEYHERDMVQKNKNGR